MQEGREVEEAGGPEHSIFGNEIDQFIKLRIFIRHGYLFIILFPSTANPITNKPRRFYCA